MSVLTGQEGSALETGACARSYPYGPKGYGPALGVATCR
jgi:hypothetical protein